MTIAYNDLASGYLDAKLLLDKGPLTLGQSSTLMEKTISSSLPNLTIPLGFLGPLRLMRRGNPLTPIPLHLLSSPRRRLIN